MKTRNDILSHALTECLYEMYKWAQPSIDLEEIIKNGFKDDENLPLYTKHYLSHENYSFLKENYMYAYGIVDNWNETLQGLINQLKKGGMEDDYKEATPERPGYRDYKKVAPLKEVISNPDDVDIIIEYINKYQNFFKGHSIETNKFTMSLALGISPCNNPDKVKEYWQNNGRPDFKIKDFRIEDVIYGGVNDEYANITIDEFLNTLK